MTAARIILGVWKYDHSTPIVTTRRDELHWLPVTCRITFKLCLTVYASLHLSAMTFIHRRDLLLISCHPLPFAAALCYVRRRPCSTNSSRTRQQSIRRRRYSQPRASIYLQDVRINGALNMVDITWYYCNKGRDRPGSRLCPCGGCRADSHSRSKCPWAQAGDLSCAA